MKLTIFTPLNHYYSAFVLRGLAKIDNYEISGVFVTPELSKNDKSIHGLFKLIYSKGIYFIIMMFILKIRILISIMLEKFFLRLETEERKNLSVEEICNENKWPIIKVENINDQRIVEMIRRSKPDIIISIFFNQIIDSDILKITEKCINIHPSYLPYYRGVSPVFWVLANNEKRTGVSIHYITKFIDSGNILSQKSVVINPKDSFHSLYFKLSLCAESLVVDVIRQLDNNSSPGITQDLKKGSYFSNISLAAIKRFRKNRRNFI